MGKRFTEFHDGKYKLYGIGGCYNDMNCKGDYTVGKGVEHFAELEDKIENGTLVELPVPFGTELYFLHSHEYADRPTSPTIHSTNKWTFEIWGNGKSGISCDDIPCGYYGVYQHQLGETVFLTRAEAEKKLKELKGEE